MVDSDGMVLKAASMPDGYREDTPRHMQIESNTDTDGDMTPDCKDACPKVHSSGRRSHEICQYHEHITIQEAIRLHAAPSIDLDRI